LSNAKLSDADLRDANLSKKNKEYAKDQGAIV